VDGAPEARVSGTSPDRDRAVGAGGPPRDLAGAEARLAERSRELDLLQSLGRRAAQAQAPAELFEATIGVLQHGPPFDLALAAHELDGRLEVRVFLARPFEPAEIDGLVRRAASFLGVPAVVADGPRRHELEVYDAALGPRSALGEEDLLLLPVLRRGRRAACLIVVPTNGRDESVLRILYGATNQLAVHFDRILTVRAAEEQRFRAIVDSMPQGVLLADEQLRVVQRNRAGHELWTGLGLAADDDLRAALERLGLGALVDRVRVEGFDCAEGEARPDGDRAFTVTVSPVRGEKARLSGLVVVLSDVSESRRLQQRLAQSEKMSGFGQMISGVAHELNNPLATIVGYAQLLGKTVGDEALARRLDILRREAERCRRIVQNLLSFARRREPETRALSLNQVVSDVVAFLRYQLDADGVRTITELSPDLPPVRGDAHQLEQVLVNLLTNARDAIREAGESGTIRIATRRAADGAVVLDVADDGPGIPEAVRPHVFDPFYTTKSAGRGTGLGLSLAHGTVTAHGGTIEILPETAPGTTVRLTLPGGAAAGTSEPGAAPDAAIPVGRPGRILVVEDEEPLALLICDALEADGHATERAADGVAALERLDAAGFDLVISDVKMPRMGGERLSEELRSRHPGLWRRLLLTTGDTVGADTDELAVRTGARVLRKPFDLDELRRTVRDRLSSR
jgi:two-component system NtrC family sensor kinase